MSKRFYDINGAEITIGCSVLCTPANEVRTIEKSEKPWIEAPVIVSRYEGEYFSWMLTDERSKKMAVIQVAK